MGEWSISKQNPAAFRQIVVKVVSGGQTGVDRAALDWAIRHGVPHGGWCPHGRITEDGILGDCYALRETISNGYRQRTRQNVIDSDGTLILNIGELSNGSLATLRLAERFRQPYLVVQMDLETGHDAVERVLAWLHDHHVEVLNVAGPRESKRPGIYPATLAFLDRLAGLPMG